jgi:hypothetical protein
VGKAARDTALFPLVAVSPNAYRASPSPQPRQILRRADPAVGFLQRFRNFLTSSHCRANFLFRCLEYATGAGAFGMSIDTLLVILILTFGVGIVLHRWDVRRHY